jgi:poly(A) polymerase
MPYSVAIQKVATRILSQQAGSVSIPKRFSSTMRDIWGLQARFHYRAGKCAVSVLEHEKFRAGYDFLCIRAQAGEEARESDIEQDCQWWTDIQKQSKEQQKNMLFNQPGKGGRKKRSRHTSKKKKINQPEDKTG